VVLLKNPPHLAHDQPASEEGKCAAGSDATTTSLDAIVTDDANMYKNTT